MTDILIVDDEKDIRELIADILEDEGYATRRAANAQECLAHLNTARPALMILDIWLKDSDMDGIDILKKVKQTMPEIPVVIISGHGNIEIAVAAIKQGAYDFIEKPFNIDQLLVVIRRAMETSSLRRENSELKRSGDQRVELIGQSGAYKLLRAQLDKVARSNGRVMLTGGAGTGKEVAARYIHAHSDRAQRPFVVVGAASIAPDKMEEVLFGHVNGDGTTEPGLLEQAHGGVIYLDEVADMPLETQSKILRVLVDQKYQPVGSGQSRQIDVRVISSTTKNLENEINAGRFRQELFHRLNVVPISVPGLQERREDIGPFAEHFISEFNTQQGLPLRFLSSEALAHLQLMQWPGNVRQLKNMIERILILGPDASDITADEIPQQDRSGSDGEAGVVLTGNIVNLPLREAREQFEREYLKTQIDRFGGNISRTASFVGMERSALHRKMKSLGVSSVARGDAD